MSPNETDLRAGLRHEAERVDAVGDFATAAIALERRRGRRRGAAIAATAFVAAAALAVPLGLSSLRGTAPVTPAPARTSQQEPTTPTGLASQSPTPSATGGTGPTAAASGVFALDDTIHVGDTVIHLTKGTAVENLAVLSNGGFLVQSYKTVGPRESQMDLLSPQGRVIKHLGVSGSYAVSPDGARVVARDGRGRTTTVYSVDGTVLGQRTDNRRPAAVVGDYAYLNSNGETTSLEWNYVTGATRELPAGVVAVSADRTRAALQWIAASADPMGDFCWAVIDLTRPDFHTLIERCGPKGNPEWFEPMTFSSDGAYLLGTNYLDGGDWFSLGIVRATDGAMVLGGSGSHLVAGWTWRLDGDALVISRNPTAPKAEQNSLQRCSLDLKCVQLAPPRPVGGGAEVPAPRYVVPRSIPR